MTLKDKISFLVSFIFSVIFGISSLIIYYMFADFRKEEFDSKLKEKALTSVNMLVEIKENDRKYLGFLDQNKASKISQDKTLIFDSNFKLLYSSVSNSKIKENIPDLIFLKKHKTLNRKEGVMEVFGIHISVEKQDYFVIVSAIDTYGNRKLEYLLYLLITSFIIFTSTCWIITSYAIKKLLQPLDAFHNKLKTINENNLDTRLNVKKPADEIDLLANEFNQMLFRIDKSYQKQKEFTSHASHELRTPLARITSQLENKISALDKNDKNYAFSNKLLDDVNQISELISSLLILSKIENKSQKPEGKYRIDEIIFDSIEKLNKNHPEFKISLHIDNINDIDNLMEINCNQALMQIAISNLLKNACLYSENHQALVFITEQNQRLLIKIQNLGQTISEDEQKKLFEPFMRGQNALGTQGLGLGLRIVSRILTLYNANIKYNVPKIGMNQFEIMFETKLT